MVWDLSAFYSINAVNPIRNARSSCQEDKATETSYETYRLISILGRSHSLEHIHMKSVLFLISRAWAASSPPKIVNFALVGICNTTIDFGVFLLAFRVFGLPIIAANFVAWFVAVSGSYIMNSMITFRAETGRVLRRKDYINFAMSGVLGVIFTTATLFVLSWYLPVTIAKLISIIVGFAVNFTMSNFVVFRLRVPKP